MTDNEFMQKVLAAFPNAEVGDDNEGQLVIYTNLCYDADGNVIEMEEL